jgi:hypothetical protein
MDSSLLPSGIEIFAGLAMIGFVYVLMVAFDVEESLLGAIPFFSLSLCVIGFSLIAFLFVLEPSWLGVSDRIIYWVLKCDRIFDIHIQCAIADLVATVLVVKRCELPDSRLLTMLVVRFKTKHRSRES